MVVITKASHLLSPEVGQKIVRRILKRDGNGIKSTTRVRNGNTAGMRGVKIPAWIMQIWCPLTIFDPRRQKSWREGGDQSPIYVMIDSGANRMTLNDK
jgi:hypothetical protein